MTGLETNIFPITNLKSLSSEFRLYRIRGLNPDQTEYHQNLQTLVRRLSYKLRSPVTSTTINGESLLVIRNDAPHPPSPFQLVRVTAILDPIPGINSLDYSVSSPETDPIRLRFLQFMLQAPLSNHPQLWQPKSGSPYFEKSPAQVLGNLNRFSGFAVRATFTPDGGLGLCVDVKNKFIAVRSLPVHMTRDQFRGWKKRHFIYHYGHRWYEIQAMEFHDLNVSEHLIRRGSDWISLLELISNESSKPLPQELAQIPHDAAVLTYLNNTGETRAAPTGLCFAVYDTHEPEVQRYHSTTLLRPQERREMVQQFMRKYVGTLRFGTTTVTTAQMPMRIPSKMFVLPDYRFWQRQNTVGSRNAWRPACKSRYNRSSAARAVA